MLAGRRDILEARLSRQANGCWLWTGTVTNGGIGVVVISRKQRSVHRLAWELSFGEIPSGLSVSQRCGVRLCCRPEHLFLGRRAADPADRLLGFVSPEPNTGCWLWVGQLDRHGYALFSFPGHGKRLGHRVAYELFAGPLRPDLELDHLCRTTACVNPAHLEQVTHGVNIARRTGARRAA